MKEADRIEDAKKADFVERIVKDDLKTALKVAEEIEDVEAKSVAFLHIFKFTGDERFLDEAVNCATQCKQRDGMLLTIVESIATFNRKKAEEIAELIQKRYYKNRAYAAILEKCNAMDLADKISCKKTLSSALKRLSLQKESVEIAINIPDPYYKALALIGLAEIKDDRKEIVDAIKRTIESVESEYLKKRLKRKLKSIEQ